MAEAIGRRGFVKAAPDRMVRGRDWRHPGLPFDHKPHDAVLFDLLSHWANESGHRRILVENPEMLYGFAKRGER